MDEEMVEDGSSQTIEADKDMTEGHDIYLSISDPDNGATDDDDQNKKDELLSFSRDSSKSHTPVEYTPPQRKRSKTMAVVREKVRKVLEETTSLAERRARMCDEGDFLRLLHAFNIENIHFS